MKRLLHIIATPREEESRTLRIADAFLEAFRAKHPDWVIDELNLFKEELPALTMQRVDGKYVLLDGHDLYGELKETWGGILAHIDRFLSADGYLITTPMWNFNIPYMLKHYIDIIVQPKYLFRTTNTGWEGLVKDKKMSVIASYGYDYTSEPAKPFNFHEPYLRAIFGFVGITDISFVVAQPMDVNRELAQQKIKEAQEAAQQLASRI